MADERVTTERLELRPLPAAAAAALPDDRETAGRLLRAALAPDWPQIDLLDVLPLQQAGAEAFGVWVMVEQETGTVVGDIGFIGPPSGDRSVEIGYSVVPDRRRRGYATEAARALAGWALARADVDVVVAACEPDNEASIRTLERVGFERTGEEGGRLRWRLYATRSASPS